MLTLVYIQLQMTWLEEHGYYCLGLGFPVVLKVGLWVLFLSN